MHTQSVKKHMPLTNEQLETIRRPSLTLKIICAALIAGVCMFGVMLCMIINFNNLNTIFDMLVLLAASSGAVMYLMSFIAFKVLSGQTDARNETTAAHFKVLQTSWIVRYAIIEGAVFLNLIVTFAENSLITLFVAVVGLLLMVIGFPRAIVIEGLLEERLKD